MASKPSSSVDGSISANHIPAPTAAHLDRGYGQASQAAGSEAMHAMDTTAATPGKYQESSPLAMTDSQQYGRFNEEWDASQRGSSIVEDPAVRRTLSNASQGETLIPTRGGTLKKKASLRRGNSLKRSGSRRSSRAGSVRSLALQPDGDERSSPFYCPVPTTGYPTEILANRFQTWRKVLKDLVAYYREVQNQNEQKNKIEVKAGNIINNIAMPSNFLQSGGLADSIDTLRQHHKDRMAGAEKARAIENDVCLALTGLRSDLQQKIKEIKNVSNDFKNSVDKEMEATKRAVQALGEVLGRSDLDSSNTTGKQDPYLLRLAVDRQIERQIDEERYLHQAYLNLETSGRELESIVVGEIQKSLNAFAGIIKREADQSYETVENLRTGPIAMPKDHEWLAFVDEEKQFVDPRIQMRSSQDIFYPGCNHEFTIEVRAGPLERRSKYLKSYTVGWYVLTPTHLHEFKSEEKNQAPIMSLYLPEQKLGTHSGGASSSGTGKFGLKGRQTGSLHRGHTWLFRAESFDTMMAWYEDIQSLTEKTPQERSAFVRKHARSVSGTSYKAGSVSSDGVVDEDDEEPFSPPEAVKAQEPKQDVIPTRPKPGGRFPSDLAVNAHRGLQVPLSPSSAGSRVADDDDQNDRDIVAAAVNLPGSGVGSYPPRSYAAGAGELSHASKLDHYAAEDGRNPYTAEPVATNAVSPVVDGAIATDSAEVAAEAHREIAAESAPEVYDPSQDARLAAVEATQIAAPDTHEALAAHESSLISAADVPTFSPASTQVSVATEVSEAPVRPPTLGEILGAGQHHQSVSTISQLHIPGEFPKPDSTSVNR